MALNIGGLTAFLQLNIQPFMQGVQQAVTATKNMGGALQAAFGTGVQNGLNGTNGQLLKMSDSFRDIQRTVKGIIISQAFYRITNSIQDATVAVQEFSMQMEVAEASFTRLLGSQEQAKGFLALLQDFAAVTPFTVQQTVEMSRRMLAMGFEAQSLKSVMQIVTDATAALGGEAQKFDRIVLALGQIKTNGKLAGQEIRQLGEAGINAREILQQELGLTKDQLQDIGKLSISGEVAVAALLKGMEKRFKGMNAVIANTTTGMLSTIKDDILLISNELNKGFFGVFRGIISKFRDSLEMVRMAIRDGGIPNALKKLVPPEFQSSILAIIGSLQSLGRSLALIGKLIGGAFVQIGATMVRILGVLLPPITRLIEILVTLAYKAVEVVPAIRILGVTLLGLLTANLAAKALLFLWRVVRIGSICTVVANAVTILTKSVKALTLVVTRNPIVGIILLISAALLQLALSSKYVGNMLDQLTAKLSKLVGIDVSNVLDNQSLVDYNKLMEGFNEQYKDLNKNFKDVGKSAEKSGKKVKDKFLASFDEVYQIPDDLNKVGDALDNFEFSPPDFPDMKLPTTPTAGEKPDTKDEENWWDKLYLVAQNTMDKISRIKFDPPWGGTAFATISDGFKRMKPVVEETLSFITTKISESIGLWKQLLVPLPIRMIFGEVPPAPVVKPVTVPLEPETSTLLTLLRELFVATIPKLILDNIPPVVKAMATAAATAAISYVTSLVTSIVEGIQTFFTKTLPTVLLSLTISPLIAMGKIAIELAGKFISGFVTPVVSGIKTFFTTTLPTLFFETIPNTIKALATIAWSASTTFIVDFITNVGTKMKTFFTETLPKVFMDALPYIGIALAAVGVAIIATLLAPVEAAAAVGGSIATSLSLVLGAIVGGLLLILPKIKDWWNDTFVPGIATLWDKFKTWTKKTWTSIATTISDVWKEWGKGFVSTWEGIKTGIKGIVRDIIDIINAMVDKINSFKIALPAVNIPGLGVVGGKTFSFNVPRLQYPPGFANGGIIAKDSIIRAGEGNKPEAILPLNNPSALRPFVQMLVEEMGMRGQETPVVNYYTVGTLIGDERSLKELERKLNALRLMERQRTGVSVNAV